MELRGERVLITGASRGIGEALADKFTDAGASVALVARTRGALETLAARLGGTAHAAETMRMIVRRKEARHGRD